ncbi:MAG TPA: chemotaxis protein CheW [Cellvibrio sp.]|nr:chemotaxis protein CheW [Cellvibrio sp.]
MGELAVSNHSSLVPDGEEAQYLTFSLGGEMFAIGILAIKEIIEYGNLTTVPMMPGFVRGVINVRGSVVPVVDLSARFGRQTSEATRRSCIVIIETHGDSGDNQDLGIMVDAVSAVMEIPSSEIEPSPTFGAKIRVDFISGMAKVNGKFVIVLNLDKVLSVEEMAMLSEAGSGIINSNQ